MAEKRCSSCGANLANDIGSVVFNCPSCGKQEILRCGKCRKNGIEYKCNKCKFEGP